MTTSESFHEKGMFGCGCGYVVLWPDHRGSETFKVYRFSAEGVKREWVVVAVLWRSSAFF